MNYAVTKNDYLSHHGVLGQKWGVRRYQNPDGSLTAEGRKRLGKDFKKNRIMIVLLLTNVAKI